MQSTRTPEYRWRGQMEISENLAYMHRQNFKIFTQNVRTTAGIGPKCQFLFGLLIRPQNAPILFGLAHQASKNPNFVRTDLSGLKNVQICSDWLQK